MAPLVQASTSAFLEALGKNNNVTLPGVAMIIGKDGGVKAAAAKKPGIAGKAKAGKAAKVKVKKPVDEKKAKVLERNRYVSVDVGLQCCAETQAPSTTQRSTAQHNAAQLHYSPRIIRCRMFAVLGQKMKEGMARLCSLEEEASY